MNIIGINTLVYMDALRDGATQSELLGSIAELGVTLAEVRREYIAGDDEFNAIANAARINGLRLFYSVPESITVNGDVNPRLSATYGRIQCEIQSGRHQQCGFGSVAAYR